MYDDKVLWKKYYESEHKNMFKMSIFKNQQEIY